MKLLYLPNEPELGWQAGPRAALEKLRDERTLSELEIYSFLQRPAETALAEILESARRSEPDAIVFTKLGRFPITDDWLRALKAIRSKPTIVYYDGDRYGRVFKRISAETKRMCRHVDLLFLCGFGSNARIFEAAGARRIFYCPHSASTTQFGAPWIPTADRALDVVLIGNRIRGRIAAQDRFPWGRMPGAYQREQLVRRLGAAFGRRFAVYGAGWNGFEGNRGPIRFERQHDVIRTSWLSIGYDHFPGTPFYFSDRLPIALLSGVAHLVHYHPGYESLFEHGRDLLWARSIDSIVDTARYALGRGPAFLNELGVRGRELASRRLVSDVVYAEMIETIAAVRSGRSITSRGLVRPRGTWKAS